EAVPWTTPRKGRRAGCCSIMPLGGGLWSGLVFGAPFFLAIVNYVSLPSETSPEYEELELKKARLAQLEARLADRELELTAFLADLVHFEKRYMQTVGRRYALLDELKAKIAEARAQQHPHRQDAFDQARQARFQAQESARAALEDMSGPPS